MRLDFACQSFKFILYFLSILYATAFEHSFHDLICRGLPLTPDNASNAVPTDLPNVESLERRISEAADALLRYTTAYIDATQSICLRHGTYRDQIVLEALKRVAFELYQRPVIGSVTKSAERKLSKPLRFIISCERGSPRLEVFPKQLSK